MGIGIATCVALGSLLPPHSAASALSIRQHATAHAAKTCTQSKSHHQVGVVHAVTGSLSVRHGKGKAKKASGQTPLHKGDVVTTGAAHGSSLEMCDGSMVYLRGKSKVALQSVTKISAKSGQVAMSSKTGATHQMGTSSGQASTHKAYFGVTLAKGKSTFVDASGLVQIKNRFGKVSLKKNQGTVASVSKAPAKPTTVNAAQTLKWTATLSWQILVPDGTLSEPRQIDLDAQGNFYVTDEYNNRVVKFSPTGSILSTWGTPGEGPGDPSGGFPEPKGIALDPSGNIYVSLATSFVDKLSPTGQVLLSFEGTPGQIDALNGPWGIALDSAGNIYVADPAIDSVKEYDPAGHYIQTFGIPTPSGQIPTEDPGVLFEPTGLTVDASGNVYVADTLNNRIQKFSPTGQPLAQWGGTRGDALGQFYGPTDLALDSKGNIFVADSGNNRIVEMTPDGKSIAALKTDNVFPHTLGFISPESVAFDKQGNLYVVDRSPGRIWKYTPPK